MNLVVKNYFRHVLRHLYINPLERCNLRCAICYTQKNSSVLTQTEILDFIFRYRLTIDLQSVTFCGGEVFLLPYFTNLVNQLNRQNIFIQIITNGTIDKLNEFSNPNLINLIVSIDGPEGHHDLNRGQGNYQKSIKYLHKALSLGFHTEVFSIITKNNYPMIDKFEKSLNNLFGIPIQITYHPRKPITYLNMHPVSNVIGKTVGFDFLDKTEILKLMITKKTFPPLNLGCFQIALMSDKKVYGCCEGIVPIGNIDDKIEQLTGQLEQRLKLWEKKKFSPDCLGCSEPNFICGLKDYLK